MLTEKQENNEQWNDNWDAHSETKDVILCVHTEMLQMMAQPVTILSQLLQA